MKRTYIVLVFSVAALLAGCAAGNLRKMPSFSRDLTQEEIDEISEFSMWGETVFVGVGDRWIDHTPNGKFRVFTIPLLWMNMEAAAMNGNKGIGAVRCTDIPGTHPYVANWVGIRQARGRFWELNGERRNGAWLFEINPLVHFLTGSVAENGKMNTTATEFKLVKGLLGFAVMDNGFEVRFLWFLNHVFGKKDHKMDMSIGLDIHSRSYP